MVSESLSNKSAICACNPGLIRFVLAITSRGSIVLMCSDLQQNPVKALELYCVRIHIETMFDMFKDVTGILLRNWTPDSENAYAKTE